MFESFGIGRRRWLPKAFLSLFALLVTLEQSNLLTVYTDPFGERHQSTRKPGNFILGGMGNSALKSFNNACRRQEQQVDSHAIAV